MLFANVNWPVAFYDLRALEDGSLGRVEADADENKLLRVRGPAFMEFEDLTVDDHEDN